MTTANPMQVSDGSRVFAHTTRYTADKHGNYWGTTCADVICLSSPPVVDSSVALRDFCKTLEEK